MKSKPKTFKQVQNQIAEIFIQEEKNWTPGLLATAIRASAMTGAFKDDAAIIDFVKFILAGYRAAADAADGSGSGEGRKKQ